uniref:Uncharacterized protein n=1 Tax=Oryza punctata TaxID=4537 RepID=A0A0E0JGB5_ORYPU
MATGVGIRMLCNRLHRTYLIPCTTCPSHFRLGPPGHDSGACFRFVAAVSAACVVAGGLVVSGLSWTRLSYAGVFFVLPMCLLYFREEYGYSVSDMPNQLEWCYVSTPVELVLLSRLMMAARQAAAVSDVRFVAIASAMWAVDTAAIGFLGGISSYEIS